MHGTRRLLFVRPPRTAGLAPIYAALAILVCVSVVELVAALWPRAPAPSAQAPADREAASASKSFDGALRVPVESQDSPPRRIWT